MSHLGHLRPRAWHYIVYVRMCLLYEGPSCLREHLILFTSELPSELINPMLKQCSLLLPRFK